MSYVSAKGPDDFLVCRVLGEDEDSTVVLAKEITTKKKYAIKILEKSSITKAGKWDQVNREKRIIIRLNHPYFVKLEHFFNDEKRLYFVLSYAERGDLQWLIQTHRYLPKPCFQFYAAELVLALEYLSSLDLIHRDLKPANILLSEDMHIQITDFGTAMFSRASYRKQDTFSQKVDLNSENSFVGTAEYVPPELLAGNMLSCSSDLWALGCIIYQMAVGETPFYDSDEYSLFQKIVQGHFQFPEYVDENTKDLINKLLIIDPNKRLGCENLGGFLKLKEHKFFLGINWENLPNESPPDMAKRDYPDMFKDLRDNEEGDGEDRDLYISKTHEKLPLSDPDDEEGYGLSLDMSKEEIDRFEAIQKNSVWHKYTRDSLILKQGELYKKRGLSVKLRQFLLVRGPYLIYVDPITLEEKGEIPWSQDITFELKTFKSFVINVPGRSYHLMDRKGNAIKWCKKLDEVKKFYFTSNAPVE